MVDTVNVIGRVSKRVDRLAQLDNLSSTALVSQIKTYLIQSAFKKGISVEIAEEVAARIVLLVAMSEPVELPQIDANK